MCGTPLAPLCIHHHGEATTRGRQRMLPTPRGPGPCLLPAETVLELHYRDSRFLMLPAVSGRLVFVAGVHMFPSCEHLCASHLNGCLGYCRVHRLLNCNSKVPRCLKMKVSRIHLVQGLTWTEVGCLSDICWSHVGDCGSDLCWGSSVKCDEQDGCHGSCGAPSTWVWLVLSFLLCVQTPRRPVKD